MQRILQVHLVISVEQQSLTTVGLIITIILSCFEFVDGLAKTFLTVVSIVSLNIIYQGYDMHSFCYFVVWSFSSTVAGNRNPKLDDILYPIQLYAVTAYICH